jgi:membrane fusion protein (multidrug efflux system)
MADTTPSTNQSTPAAAQKESQPRRPAMRLILLCIVGLLLTVVFYYGLDYTVRAFTHESTDDAFLEGDVVAVAPRVAGQVQVVHIRDNQFVKRGEPLVELDPRDFEVRLAQKRAAVAAADANLGASKAGLALTRARFDTAEANQRQEKASTDAARATAERAQADLKRNELLRLTGVVSLEEFDRVRADATSAQAYLDAAEQKAAAAVSQVSEARAQVGVAETMLEAAVTRTTQARADEQAADLDLSYTKVVAPCDGWVTRKAVEPGAYVQVGQSLLALVPASVWVLGNFKETQLTHMRPGQIAKIHIDAYPGKALLGHVDSIMAGSGARFSLLPPENAVGNYVKVVQRVPVKILFDDPPDPAMSLGPGMSVVPEVRTSAFALPAAVLCVGAVLLAVLAAMGLARVIAHLRD